MTDWAETPYTGEGNSTLHPMALWSSTLYPDKCLSFSMSMPFPIRVRGISLSPPAGDLELVKITRLGLGVHLFTANDGARLRAMLPKTRYAAFPKFGFELPTSVRLLFNLDVGTLEYADQNVSGLAANETAEIEVQSLLDHPVELGCCWWYEKLEGPAK